MTVGNTDPDKGRALLIRSSFFLHAKKAGARKSSPAKGKEKGCGCEDGLTHINTSHGMIVVIIIPFSAKCNRHFSQFKAKGHTREQGSPGEEKNSPPEWADCFDGAGDEARTRYLHLGKVALYQMSYTRNNEKYFTTFSTLVKA